MSDTSPNQPGVVPEPLRAYNFMVTIAGHARMYFTEVSGLGVRVEPILYREGGLRSVVRSFAGQVSYPPVTLRFGVSMDADLFGWLMSAVEGRTVRNEVEISLLDNTGNVEAVGWVLNRAWPMEWHGAPLRALDADLAIDTLVLAHEGITRRPAQGLSGV